ncbi:MlaD family protein [Paracoccus sp. Z330]|uniref:MlaD family protein n=1 Tax=Paracoccus onchidii TaxID=3017813 RepID=A0ABT4ZJ06_9RHOB|nr:MlaD family protein [Paracoccus onchidii]MDB6179351.1 MlaD family protein [Paracoccus onchidii]
METKANYALIGAFAIAGFLGILGFLVWFAKLELDQQFSYYDAYFNEVSGLGISSDVRFAGLKVGSVVDIDLAPESSAPVRVRLEVDEDTPIRVSSRASVESQGVTGVSNISITSGSPDSPRLTETEDTPIPVIKSSQSALQKLTQEGPEIIDKLGDVADRLAQLLSDENVQRVSNILDNVEDSSANLDQALSDVSSATGAIGKAADGIAAFGGKLDTLSQTADTALENFSQAAKQADGTMAAATKSLDEIQNYVSGDLKDLTETLDQAAGSLQSDLNRLAARAEDSLSRLDVALTSGNDAFKAATDIFGTDLAPIISDLSQTLGKVNTALDSVAGDLPDMMAQLRTAAASAADAFTSLRRVLDSAHRPVQNFATEALPQFSRLSMELRGLVADIDQLVGTLKRNPAQLLTGPRTPEFRR